MYRLIHDYEGSLRRLKDKWHLIPASTWYLFATKVAWAIAYNACLYVWFFGSSFEVNSIWRDQRYRIWSWEFSQTRRWRNTDTSELRWQHIDPSVIQRTLHEAVLRSGIPKPIGCHTFRYSFVTHLPEVGYDIRTIQELLEHSDVKTTMVYTLVPNRGGLAVQSPMIGCDFFPNLVKMT